MKHNLKRIRTVGVSWFVEDEMEFREFTNGPININLAEKGEGSSNPLCPRLA